MVGVEQEVVMVVVQLEEELGAVVALGVVVGAR